MNYNIDHNYLKEPLFEKLTGSRKYVTLMVLSIIRHFTKNHVSHTCIFYSTKFAHDIGVKPATVSTAVKYLLELGEIKCVRAYQRKGNMPAIYVSQRYSPSVKKVYPLRQKGIAPGDKVNNYNNNYKQNNDGINIPHDSLIVGSIAWVEEQEKKLNINR